MKKPGPEIRSGRMSVRKLLEIEFVDHERGRRLSELERESRLMVRRGCRERNLEGLLDAGGNLRIDPQSVIGPRRIFVHELHDEAIRRTLGTNVELEEIIRAGIHVHISLELGAPRVARRRGPYAGTAFSASARLFRVPAAQGILKHPATLEWRKIEVAVYHQVEAVTAAIGVGRIFVRASGRGA